MQKTSGNLQLGDSGCQKATSLQTANQSINRKPIYKQKANYNMLRSVREKCQGGDLAGLPLTREGLC